MRRIGLVGAGTMGAGIALVAAQAGFDVLLYDIGPSPLASALGRTRRHLERQVQRGTLPPAELDATLNRITTTTALGDLGDVDFVIEAAPESLELKREIFQKLDRVCRPGVVLATNTSALSVTEIGALAGRHPSVVGMHFFNPVPAMRLVEVVEGDGTAETTIAATCDLATRLGKTPVRVKDTPGFVVNRIAHPFTGEAVRLRGENVASIRQIDRIARLACGFRMGPFEVMDLVGLDSNLAVNKSIFAQFFHDPRFRPHPLQERMVMAGRLGRKSQSGWYEYANGKPVDPPEESRFYGKPGPRLDDLRSVAVLGDPDLAELVELAGYRLVDCCADADLIVVGAPELLVGRNPQPEALVLAEVSRLSTTELAAGIARPERVVGYSAIPGVQSSRLVEIAPGLRTRTDATERVVQFIHSLGRETEVVEDGPGLVAARLVACIVNEAAFTLQEGAASVEGIDTAMRLGVNYPNGPLEWADEIGSDVILSVLEGLHRQTGDDRYRPSPHLRKLVAAGGYFYDPEA